MLNFDKYQRIVPLLCPTCGHDKFKQTSEVSTTICCEKCERTFLREELHRENEENMHLYFQEMDKGINKDIEKEFKNILKKSFGRNKHIIIR